MDPAASGIQNQSQLSHQTDETPMNTHGELDYPINMHDRHDQDQIQRILKTLKNEVRDIRTQMRQGSRADEGRDAKISQTRTQINDLDKKLDQCIN